MEEIRIPELHFIGIENNRIYQSLLTLFQGRSSFISFHCMKPNEKINPREIAFSMRSAETVYVVVGSKAEYKKLRVIARRIPEKTVFILQNFPGRERCTSKDFKALLVEAGSRTVEIVGELISMAISDSMKMLGYSYKDLYAACGYRTVVRYKRFSCSNEEISCVIKNTIEKKKTISLLYYDGAFTLPDILDITNTVCGADNKALIGCSMEGESEAGILWFVRDTKEPTQEMVRWQNPFKREPVRWLKIGCCIFAFLSLVLSARLLKNENGKRVVTVTNGDSEMIVRTVRTVKLDDSGKEIFSCKRDVVELIGEEYADVAPVIEKEFSIDGIGDEMEGHVSIGTGSGFVESNLICKRYDGEIISYLLMGHYSVGDAGGLVKEGYTYSVKNAKRLTIDDIIIEGKKDEFYRAVDSLIIEELKKIPKVGEFHIDVEREYKENYGEGALPSWLLSAEGLTFLFKQGDFGPMALEPFEVTISGSSKINSYIREEYR